MQLHTVSQTPRVNGPLISIVIPCFNAALWVRDTIDSCLASTYQPLEVIVVDDGSNDDSLQILYSYGSLIRVFAENHRGGCAARNYAFAHSSGEYVIFLDADDLIAEDTVEKLVNVLIGKKNTVATCAWQYLLLRSGQWCASSDHIQLAPPRGDYLYSWLAGWFIPPHAMLWPREVIAMIGGWDESLVANQDGDLVYRALLSGVQFTTIEEGMVYYRQHHGTSHISTSIKVSPITIYSRFRVLIKVEERLIALGQLDRYALPLSWAFHTTAVGGFGVNTRVSRECVRHARRLTGFRSVRGSVGHRLGCYLLGLENKERLARLLAWLGLASEIRRRRMMMLQE